MVLVLEIVDTVFGIARELVPPIIREARYFFCFNDVVEELRDKKNTWICGDNRWFEEAETVLDEAEQNKARLHGWCPNCISRYRLSRRVAKLFNRMAEINAAGNLHNFLPGMNSYSSENFVSFKCTKKAYDEILETLNNDEVFKIGLHGMGGCGKTLLVEQMGIEAEKLGMKVVFVVVSNRYKLDTESIQNQMAESLNFPLTENSTTIRAQKLLGRLSAGKKTLLILDDVWAALDFKTIGIPEGCKVLITTRSLDVCNAMKCQRKIPLELLTDEEGLTLFGKHAATTGDDDTCDLAQKIVIECKGLPVAIVAIASILNGKHADDWRLALKNLQNYEPINIPEGLKDHYTCLRTSYELLKDEEAKKVFMLCALFPDDSEISLTILTRFAFGLDLYGDSLYDLCRMKVGSAIRKLVNSSLLLDAKGRCRYVKLHDMVHDVALLIAKEEAQETIVTGKDLNELEKDAAKKNIRRLYCHKINEFPDWLDCSELEILFVDWDGNNSPKVPDAFFEKTKMLRVFSVIDRSKSSWHTSTLLRSRSTHLRNLRTLRLEGCILDDVSFLANLSNLGTLELRDCIIIELPNKISEIQYLRSLDVSHCTIQGEGNPYEVVGGCSQLEELHFLANDISKSVLEADNLIGFLQNGKLETYHLQIGSRIEHLLDDQTLTTTFLTICQKCLDASTLNARIKKLVQRAQVLLLSKIQQGCKTIIPDMVQDEEGMNGLAELVLLDVGVIECLIDSTSTNRAFSKLAKIRIENMQHLEALNRGQLPSGFLEKLEKLLIRKCSQLQNMLFPPNLNLCSMKVLILENCPKLTYLFTPSVAQSLVHLEELKITECDGLNQIIITREQETLVEDKYQKSYFKQLKELVITRCKQMKWLIPVSFAVNLLQLERLEIIDAPELTYVFGPDNQIMPQKLAKKKENKPQIIELPVLKVLHLVNLPIATGICPEKYHPKWPTPVKVDPRECPQLKIPCLDQLDRKQKHTLEHRCLWCSFDWIVPHVTPRRAARWENHQISHLKQMARVDSFPDIDELIFSNRTKLAYDMLWENLQDDEVSMIALWGMGGIGKTTLAKKVAKNAELLFNKVVFVVVSRNIDIRKIQGRIASALDLELEEEEENARAERLHTRLISRERILIVLDDVWEKLDLKTIGIPSSYDHKGCVVLLTTRSLHVCTLMDCQKMIQLDLLLSEEDAWVLFQKHAGFNDDISNSLKSLAHKISLNCQGLPVLIAATASTLKGKPEQLWAKTLEKMRSLIALDAGEKFLMTLRLSYDNLEDEEAKELLLVCCLFENDSEIPVESLIRYGIALGLFGEDGSYESGRVRALAIINKLIDSTLLLQGEEEWFVKMNDLIRDMLQWANKEIQVIKRSLIQKMPPPDTRFLCCADSIEFPAELDCPRLEILIVSGEGKGSTDKFPDVFIATMKELRVLVLLNKGSVFREKPILAWPKSIFSANLRCLHLEGWGFGDISIVSNLESLDSLTLWSCSFHDLPNGIAFKQKKLRLLDLRRCEIEMNPWEVIGNCSGLEELYFIGNRGEWESDHQNYTANFFNIRSRLKRYDIDTGALRVSESADQYLPTELHVSDFDHALISNSAIKEVMGRAKVVSLGRIRGVGKSFIPNIAETMNELSELELFESEEIECLIDNTNKLSHRATVLNKLIKLSFESMDRMKVIYYGPPAPGLFERLEELYIMGCLQLQGTLFVGELNLRSLRVLKLYYCPELTSLFEEDARNPPQVCFPELIALVVTDCYQLKHLFTLCSSHEFPKLEHLIIKYAPHLEEVFSVKRGEIIEEAAVRVPNLKYIVLIGMPRLKSVCTGIDFDVLKSSVYLFVDHCPKLSLDSTISREDLGRLYRNEVKGAKWHSVLRDTIQTILRELNKDNKFLYRTFSSEVLGRKESTNEQTRTNGHAADSQRSVQRNETTELKRDTKEILSDVQRILQPAPLVTSFEKMSPQDLMENTMSKSISLEEHSHEENRSTNETPQRYENPSNLARSAKNLSIESASEAALTLEVSSSDKPSPLIFSISEITEHGSTSMSEQKTVPPSSQASNDQSMPQDRVGSKQDSDIQDQTIGSPNLTENFQENVEPTVVEGSKSHKDIIATLSAHSEASNPSPGPLAIHQRSVPPQELEDQISVNVKTMLLDQQHAIGDPKIAIEVPQKSNIPYDDSIEDVVKDRIQEGPILEDAMLATLSAELGGLNMPLQEAVQRELLNKTRSETIMTDNQRPVDNVQECPPSMKAALKTVILHKTCTKNFEETVEQTVLEGSKPHKHIITNLSTHSEASNLSPGLLAIPQQSGSPVELVGKESSNETITMDQEVPEETRSEFHSIYPQNILQGSVQENPSAEKVKKISSSLYLEPETSLRSPSVNSMQESTNEPLSKEQEALGENENMYDIPLRVDEPCDLTQSAKEAVNENDAKAEINRTAPAISSIISELKDSADSPSFTLSGKASPLIPSIPTSKEVNTVTSPSQLEPSSSLSCSSNVPIQKTFPQITASQAKTDIDKEAKVNPIYLQDLKDNIFSLYEFMEEDGDGQVPILHSISKIPTNHPVLQDKEVAKALADLEASLEMPLKDIAGSEANNHCLQKALNVLSRSSSENGTLLEGLQATIDSLCQKIPGIMSSFKQASTTINKFREFEEKEKSIKEELPQRKEVTNTLFSEIDKTKNLMIDTQRREEYLKEHIARLQAELKNAQKEFKCHEANLSCLTEQVKKFHADAIESKEHLMSAKKDKFQMMEEEKQAQIELSKADYEWWALRNKFQQNCAAAMHMSSL